MCSRNVAISSGTFFCVAFATKTRRHFFVLWYRYEPVCVWYCIGGAFKEIPFIDKSRFCNEWSINNNWKIFIFLQIYANEMIANGRRKETLIKSRHISPVSITSAPIHWASMNGLAISTNVFTRIFAPTISHAFHTHVKGKGRGSAQRQIQITLRVTLVQNANESGIISKSVLPTLG